MDMGSDVYSLMQTGKPLRSYVKTIMGKVFVYVLSPFDGKVEGRILEGDPKRKLDSMVVDVWTDKEDAYFKRANVTHFRDGTIVSYTRPLTPEQKSVNEMSDEEIVKVLSEPFFTLKNMLSKLTAVAPVYRLLEKARELEKSEKVVSIIEQRLSELQEKEFNKE